MVVRLSFKEFWKHTGQFGIMGLFCTVIYDEIVNSQKDHC